jgi:hypothetical protein
MTLLLPLLAHASPGAQEPRGEPAASPPPVEQQAPASKAAAATGAAPSAKPSAAAAAADTTAAPAKQPEPISGAFGIPLGKPFEASMVAQVLDQRQHRERVKKDLTLEGKVLRVEPLQPDPRFVDYRVRTTAAGVVYAVEADGLVKSDTPPVKQQRKQQRKQAQSLRNRCKAVVKQLDREFVERFGKARGRGYDHQWAIFRQVTEESDRKLRLNGYQCGKGAYGVIYSDEKLRRNK